MWLSITLKPPPSPLLWHAYTQVRLPNTAQSSSVCNTASRISAALTDCGASAHTLALEAALQQQLVVSSSAPGSSKMGAGVDPVFVSTSRLYNDGLDSAEYYNLTEGAGEGNVNGNPWGYFSYDIPGMVWTYHNYCTQAVYAEAVNLPHPVPVVPTSFPPYIKLRPASGRLPLRLPRLLGQVPSNSTLPPVPAGQPIGGFPIVIPVVATQSRIPTLLASLKDGVYLNKHLTQTLTVQLATFNIELHTFATFSASFSWVGSGLITGTFKVDALLYKPPYSLGRTDLQVGRVYGRISGSQDGSQDRGTDLRIRSWGGPT